MKIKSKKIRTGVYGGTYNPVHNGHIAAADAFLKQMKLDELLIIPAAIPPHKPTPGSDSPEHRLNMCRLAFADVNKTVVSDIEVRRKGASYTVDTLQELSAPDRELFLLCGTDMMLSFDTWRHFECIFTFCTPVYIRRENDADITKRIIDKNNEYYAKYKVKFIKINADPVIISSSEIREKIRHGEDIFDYVPLCVAEYIRENNLYVK